MQIFLRDNLPWIWDTDSGKKEEKEVSVEKRNQTFYDPQPKIGFSDALAINVTKSIWGDTGWGGERNGVRGVGSVLNEE